MLEDRIEDSFQAAPLHAPAAMFDAETIALAAVVRYTAFDYNARGCNSCAISRTRAETTPNSVSTAPYGEGNGVLDLLVACSKCFFWRSDALIELCLS